MCALAKSAAWLLKIGSKNDQKITAEQQSVKTFDPISDKMSSESLMATHANTASINGK